MRDEIRKCNKQRCLCVSPGVFIGVAKAETCLIEMLSRAWVKASREKER